jgi:hypothetical protein
MGDIKRQINSITDLKRGSTNVNFVYRGATLVWQRSTPTTNTVNTFDTTMILGLLKPTQIKYASTMVLHVK